MIKHIILDVGKVYKNNNGSDFECIKILGNGSYLVERTTDKWRCEVHGVYMYSGGESDGLIEWDYSTHGRFFKKCKHCDNEAVYQLEVAVNKEIDVCENCNDMYSYCAGCECAFLREDLYFENSKHYCSDCYQDAFETQENYGSTWEGS